MPRQERVKCAKCRCNILGTKRRHDSEEIARNLGIYERHHNIHYQIPCFFCNQCRCQFRNFAARVQNGDLLQNNAELAQDNAELAQENAELAQDNAEVAQDNAEVAQDSADIDQDNAELIQDNADCSQYNGDLSQNKVDRNANFVHNEADEANEDMPVGESSDAFNQQEMHCKSCTCNESEMSTTVSENVSTEDNALLNVQAEYSQSSSVLANNKSLGSRLKKQYVKIPNVASVPATESRCFMCPHASRKRVPKSAIDQLWATNKIYIPPGSRTCETHLENGGFTSDAMDLISRKVRMGALMLPAEIGDWMKRITGLSMQDRKIIDVDSGEMEDSDFQLLFGVSKAQFDEMYDSIKAELRDSCNRSARTALGIFLAKLRLGISQRLLAFLFGIDSQRKISKILSRVAKLLDKHFVPKHLGYTAKSREELLKNNNVELITKLFEANVNESCIFLDGTYLYIQKSRDHKFQRQTYSLHKYRNLLKIMMVVLPDGQILAAEGPYLADYANSDSNILDHMLTKDDGIASYIKPGDHLIVDRGFQNVLKKLKKDHKVKTHMPALLKKKQQQFTTKQANDTRRITMVRWIVESANGRIKNVFKFFDQVIPSHYYINDSKNKLGAYFRVACAMLNAFYPPLFTNDEKHQRILEAVEKRSNLNNTLLRDVKVRNLYRSKANWKEITDLSAVNFPKLTEDDLFDITLGIYQTKNAFGYKKEHFQDYGTYKLLIHEEKNGLLRLKVQSRYHKNDSHDVWIEYNEDSSGEKITRYYCTCKVGSRTLGCCSHVACPLWFLGYRRHLAEPFEPTSYGKDILNAFKRHAAVIQDSESESEEENVVPETNAPGASQDSVETEIEDLPTDDEFYRDHFKTIDLIERERSIDIVPDLECSESQVSMESQSFELEESQCMEVDLMDS